MFIQAANLYGAVVTGRHFSKEHFGYINNFVSLLSFSGGGTQLQFPYCTKPSRCRQAQRHTSVMPVFTTDKKQYLISESKSWGWTVVFTLILYIGLKFFISMRQNNINFGLIFIFIMKLMDTLTQYHVNVIQIDKKKGKMNLRLESLMTGDDYKTYDLRNVSSELVEEKSWWSLNKTHLKLKIHLPGKKMLQITNRYGFKEDTLRVINDTLKIQYF